MPLSANDKTVIREEQTFVVTQSNSKFVIDGVSQAPLTLVEGNVYTFDLSDSSVGSHPFRIRKNPDTSANSLTSGLPTGYSAITSSQYSGTVSNIETDDTNELYATNNHIDFDLGSVKVIHNFIAKFRSNADDSYSADYRIELHSGTAFDSTTLLAFSPTLVSENTTDIQTIDHDFGGVSARYVRWKYTGGARTSYLRYFHPYIDTSNESLITSGTQGQSGATAKYVVPFGSGPLAYYCASHSGMGADIATPANASMFDGALPILKTTDAFGNTLGTGNNEDPYAANLVLAIPMNGANNGTTFTDVSNVIRGTGSAKTITTPGRNNDIKTSTDQSFYYGSSAKFDGQGDKLALPASSDYEFGDSDFTIETWFRPDSTSRMAIYHGSNGTDWSVGIDYSYITQTIAIWASSNGTSWNLADGDSAANRGSTVVPVGAWTHIAYVRDGGRLLLFVNGVLDKEFSVSGSIKDRSSADRRIGVWFNGSYDLAGYLADFRIYKGVAKYTSDFFVPTPVDVLDRSGNDNNASNAGATFQTSVKKFYDGAAEFDGSSSIVNVPYSSDLDPSTGDYTVELWAHWDANQNGTLLSWHGGNVSARWDLGCLAAGTLRFFIHNGVLHKIETTVPTSSWLHIAAQRRGNTMELFVNGSPAGTTTISGIWPSASSSGLLIGCRNPSTGNVAHMNGYIQDVRIYKGIAKYTSSFSPPERSVQGTARRYPSGVYVVS